MEQVEEKNINYKKPWQAAILSFFLPGAGHFYLGERKKALIFFASILAYLTVLRFVPFITTFDRLSTLVSIGFLFNLLVLFNAISDAKKLKATTIKRFDQWHFYVLGIAFVYVLYFLLYKPFIIIFAKNQFAESVTTSMSPLLKPGDRFMWQSTNQIERNDVIVFESPHSKNEQFVFRCVALPGDNFEIKNGKVFINNNYTDKFEQLKFRYLIQAQGKPDIGDLKELRINEIVQISDLLFEANITESQAKELLGKKNIVAVTPNFELQSATNETIFPNHPNIAWNTDYYGPIKLPKKGETVSIDNSNAAFYAKLIELYETVSSCSIDAQGFLELNGNRVNTYQFKHSYYFVMGDNRHNAADSRYFGPLPEDKIQGKLLFIWWSEDDERIGN